MDDQTTTIADVKRLLRQFTKDRDWEQFHHPKDLGLALAIEVGEILEHFRYRTNDEITHYLAQPDAHREASHELADTLWLLVRLADVMNVDLAGALEEKMAIAHERYPVHLARGRADKYTVYTERNSMPDSREEPSS